MSLVLRRIALENFRKFREPREISGLTDGLNIVMEPNETGKSTLLEAIRAALFLKHNSRTQLISSFQPHGDEVGPEVALDFEVNGESYALRKRFISRTQAELSGPGGRSQGAEAEEALQRLLGFEQARGFDSATAGALGMLWVAQTEGLWLHPPGDRVRDLIGATLEGEAGTILGSAAFDKVRGRIETQFRQFYTESGRIATSGRLAAAQQRVDAAAQALAEATQREAALEQAFLDLDNARRQLATLRRDIDDEQDAAERADLQARLSVARGATQLLATRQAQALAAKGRLDGLEDLSIRHQRALEARSNAQSRRDTARENRALLAEHIETIRGKAAEAALELGMLRAKRDTAKTSLSEAKALEAMERRSKAIAAAHDRHCQAMAMEADRAGLLETAARDIPAKVLEELEDADRDLTRARTLLEAGSTRVELVGAAPGLTRDGKRMPEGEWALTSETRIGLPGGGYLVLRPAQSVAGARRAFDDASARLASLLEKLEVTSLAEARVRSDAAREARQAATNLDTRIAAATPADPEIGLPQGIDALRSFVEANPLVPQQARADARPIAELEAGCEQIEVDLARIEARHAQAAEDLREAEGQDTPLAIEENTAERDIANAQEELDRLSTHSDFEDLEHRLAEARERNALAAVELEDAKANAQAFDEEALLRRVAGIDTRRAAAEHRRIELTTEVAVLEAKVENEGGKGLAEHAEAAREEHEAACATLARVTEEAETLRLLRETLADAQAETARTITGPVATRAARYVARILPGGEPAFGDDLGLAAIRRGGYEETCDQLSRGTQEQLAVLTRLAFADMLLEEGRPVSLILDDPLVYSDDVRLDAMIDLLVETAERMQVIILTCRERAFRHVAGNRIRI